MNDVTLRAIRPAVGFMTPNGTSWKVGERRSMAIQYFTREEVLQFVNSRRSHDPNPIHRDHAAAKAMGEQVKIVIPKGEVIVPGALIFTNVTSCISEMLGSVAIRKIEKLQFKRFLVTGEMLIIKVDLISFRHPVGVFTISDIADGGVLEAAKVTVFMP